MIHKREVSKVIIYEPAKTRLSLNQCPGCGKPKEDWTRRKDWRCCSVECTDKFQDFYITYGWPDLRMRALKRDNFTCVKCGDNRKEVEVTIKYRRITNWEERMSSLHGKFEYEDAERKEMRTNFIGDHIIPIAIGGDQWDLDNIQTLCIGCNKIKTKKDQADIAKLRRKSKVLKTNSTLQ